jgi:hypothetical protein
MSLLTLRMGSKICPLALVLVCGGAALFIETPLAWSQCGPVQWKSIGPGPLIIPPNDETDGQGPDSGMVRDIAIDPSGSSDQTIYVATDNGGIWKTTDGGFLWTPKTESMPSLNMGAVALDPGNPSIVYAGTGNEKSQNGLKWGAGIYKSLNGGDSWTIVGGGFFTNVAINCIVMPAPSVLLIASSAGVYQSSNGGTNYSLVISGDASDIDLDTASSTIAYASINSVGIFKLVNTGGAYSATQNIFTAGNGGPTNFGSPSGYLKFAQSVLPNNQTMCVNVQLNSGPVGGGMFISTNGGLGWNQVTATNNDLETCVCGYGQTIGVDPQDATRIYIGARSLWMVTNGAVNGITINNRIDRFRVHADQHALVFSPPSHLAGGSYQLGRRTPLYNGTDGGIATTADATPPSGGSLVGGGSWRLLNGNADCSPANGALATVLFRQIDIGRGSTLNNGYTYGAAQDLAISVHTPDCQGTPWALGQGGDAVSVAVDPLDPTHAYAVGNASFFGTVDGKTWQQGGPGSLPNFVYFDPNGGVVYAPVANQLFQSTNNGTNFAAIHTFPAQITAISIEISHPNTIWVGLNDGTVQHSANALAGAGSAWVASTVSAGVAGQAVSGIAIEPSTETQVVVVYPGTSLLSSANRVFATLNTGSSWFDISGDLPNLPVRSVVIDPNTTPHAIIVATDSGVMRTMDFGATWQVLGQGLPNIQCNSLALDSSAFPSLLRVGTYGRGAFELDYDREYVDTKASIFQQGTREEPYIRVGQALDAPRTGGAVSIDIRTGTYSEAVLTIHQCCVLHAINGPVTIR